MRSNHEKFPFVRYRPEGSPERCFAVERAARRSLDPGIPRPGGSCHRSSPNGRGNANRQPYFSGWAFNPTAQRSQLRVVAKDEEDRVLYEQHGSDTSFGRKLDVHELPDGRYSILLKVGRTQHRFELVLHSTRQHLAKISSY